MPPLLKIDPFSV